MGGESTLNQVPAGPIGPVRATAFHLRGKFRAMAFSDKPSEDESGTGASVDGWKTIAISSTKQSEPVKTLGGRSGHAIHRVPGGGNGAVYAIAQSGCLAGIEQGF